FSSTSKISSPYVEATRSANSRTRSKEPINTKSGLNYRPTLVSQTRYRTLSVTRRFDRKVRLDGPGNKVVILRADDFDVDEAAPGNSRRITFRQVDDRVDFGGLSGEAALEDQLVLR